MKDALDDTEVCMERKNGECLHNQIRAFLDMDDIFNSPIMMLSFLSCLFPRKNIVCVSGGSFSTPFSKTAAAAASAT